MRMFHLDMSNPIEGNLNVLGVHFDMTTNTSEIATHHTDDFSIVIQIQRKIRLALMDLVTKICSDMTKARNWFAVKRTIRRSWIASV